MSRWDTPKSVRDAEAKHQGELVAKIYGPERDAFMRQAADDMEKHSDLTEEGRCAFFDGSILEGKSGLRCECQSGFGKMSKACFYYAPRGDKSDNLPSAESVEKRQKFDGK